MAKTPYEIRYPVLPTPSLLPVDDIVGNSTHGGVLGALLKASRDDIKKTTDVFGNIHDAQEHARIHNERFIPLLELAMKITLEKQKQPVELAAIEAELRIKEKTLELQECNRRLACAKAITEEAQTKEKDENGVPLIDPNSALYWQNLVLSKQADGYDRDAEQKASKLIIDTWITRRNTNDEELVPATLTNDGIDKAVRALGSGINVVL